MAKLTKSAFLSKYASIFADNSTREISEEDLRDFRLDIADSFLNIADAKSIQSLDTTGSTITINMLSLDFLQFLGSATIGASKAVAFSNTTYALKFVAMIESSGAYTLDFPANTIMQDFYSGGIWDNSTKVLTLATGKYRIEGTYDGTTWQLDLYGPYTS
jgi:hypothetical protein